MRRTTLPAAILLGLVATPVLALDLGRWLPTLELPQWPRIEAPSPGFEPGRAAPAPVEGIEPASPPEASASAAPPDPVEIDPTTQPALDASPRDPRRSRPRGWRGLLPGSLK